MAEKGGQDDNVFHRINEANSGEYERIQLCLFVSYFCLLSFALEQATVIIIIIVIDLLAIALATWDTCARWRGRGEGVWKGGKGITW